jgi:hypothetical protein
MTPAEPLAPMPVGHATAWPVPTWVFQARLTEER